MMNITNPLPGHEQVVSCLFLLGCEPVIPSVNDASFNKPSKLLIH